MNFFGQSYFPINKNGNKTGRADRENRKFESAYMWFGLLREFLSYTIFKNVIFKKLPDLYILFN